MSGPSASDGQRSKLTVPLYFLTEVANAGRIDELCDSIAQWMPQIFPADPISIALPAGDESAVDASSAPDRLETAGGYRPLNILVAEDNEFNQQIIALILQRVGHAFDVVQNGAQAVAAVQQESYDLILMDIQMPEMDGISATRAIRALEGATSQTPIIALTANAMKGGRDTYLGAGMNDYLSKPISPDALEAALSGQTGSVAGLTELIPASPAQTPSATPQAGLDAELDTLFDHLDFDDA